MKFFNCNKSKSRVCECIDTCRRGKPELGKTPCERSTCTNHTEDMVTQYDKSGHPYDYTPYCSQECEEEAIIEDTPVEIEETKKILRKPNKIHYPDLEIFNQ